jgi:hypothetical protein
VAVGFIDGGNRRKPPTCRKDDITFVMVILSIGSTNIKKKLQKINNLGYYDQLSSTNLYLILNNRIQMILRMTVHYISITRREQHYAPATCQTLTVTPKVVRVYW